MVNEHKYVLAQLFTYTGWSRNSEVVNLKAKPMQCALGDQSATNDLEVVSIWSEFYWEIYTFAIFL